MKDETAARSSEDDPLRLDREIGFPLYAAANLLNRLYGPLLAPLGLTYPQYLVMLILWQDEPRTVGELGTQLYLDSGTLTPLLKRMEKAQFVIRKRDASDERRVLISLTGKGRRLRRSALQIPQTLAGSCNVTAADTLRDSVRDLVTALARNAKNIQAASL